VFKGRSLGRNLALGNEKTGSCRRSAVKDQCYTAFQRGLIAPNLEVAIGAMRRELIWIERHNFHGWACSACEWEFKPLGPLVGESIHDMKRLYEEQRDKEFASHVCAEHPRATKNLP